MAAGEEDARGVDDDEEQKEVRRQPVEAPKQPGEVEAGRQRPQERVYHCRPVEEAQPRPRDKLEQKAGENKPPEAVEEIDVRRDALRLDVVGKRLKFQPFFEPGVDGGASEVPRGAEEAGRPGGFGSRPEEAVDVCALTTSGSRRIV